MGKKLFRLMLATVLALVMMVTVVDVQAAKKVWMLGDSTMTEYDDSEPTGGRGWGMYFGNFLSNGWSHENMAKGGRDSRGGYQELWASCKNDVEAGDYVIIQFAHNDAACGGIDYNELIAFLTETGDTEGLTATKAIGRGTNPSTTYKQMLKKICDEVKAQGATPILASAVCRCYMQNGVVRRDGRHDIGGSYDAIVGGQWQKKLSVGTDDHSYDYGYQMKQLANEEGVAFIDMTTATADLMASYEAQGDGNAFAVMFDKKQESGNDGTHYNVTGALLAARLCAQLIQQEKSNYSSLETLAENIYVPTDMSFNPSTADMGEVYVGQAATKEISISALGLDPADGTVNITADNGIMLSFDKQSWEDNLDADYTMGTLIKTFYVKVPITATGAVNGTVTATLGDKHIDLPVSVTGIELGGGDPFTATWDLNANGQPTTTEGVSVTAANVAYSSLDAKGYDSTDGAQIAETGSTGAWNAKRIDNIENEYVEYSITAPAGRTIDIANIAMQIKEKGGDHLHFHIKSSTDNFATETSLYGFQAANDTWTDYNKSVNVKLEEGQTLSLRVYPWSDEITTGNWLCIRDVVITGQSKDANGVNISGTITYALDKGGLTQGDDAVMSPETLAAGFGYKGWSAGNALIVKGTATYQGKDGEDNIVQTAIVNNTGSQWPNTGGRDYILTLTLTPDYGFQFVPSKVSFKAARYGTGSGKISASIAVGDTQEVLYNDADVNRGATGATIASFATDVTTSMTATADNSLKLNFWFPGLNGDNRTMGLSDVVVEGTLVGAPETGTQKYLLNTSVSPAETGSVTRTPALDMYKEGAQVKLTAVPANGYKFTEWQDGSGSTVATTTETTVTMDAQKTMKAIFEVLPPDPVVIPTLAGEYISWKEATLEKASIENSGANIGSTGGSTVATFTIHNDIVQDYTLNFLTGAKSCSAKVKVTVSNDANTYLDKTVDITDTGAWDLTEEHPLNISQLPVGDFTLKFAVTSNTGNYAGNWGNLSIRKAEASSDDPQDDTPTGAVITMSDGSDFDTHDGGTPGGASAPRWETANNNWGYIKDGSTLTYTVKCNQTGRVKVSIEDTKIASDGTATFTFKQGDNTVAEAVVSATQSNYGTDDAETNAQLTAGETYTLVVTFNGSGGGWIMNCRNFQFENINDTEPVYALTTASSPAEGGTVKPNGGSYKAGASVALTATANPYYTFSKWEDESTDAARTLTMPAEATTATAYFVASPLTIPTIDTNPFKIEWAKCNNGTWNGTNLDSFSSGGTATYTITNTNDCSYILKYEAASASDGVHLKMQIKQGENVVFEETKDVDNTGNWQTYKEYSMNTTSLPQGEYTFVITFLRDDGSYTANVKNIAFKVDKPIEAGQMLTLSIDGIAQGESVLDPLVAEGHAATITSTFTAQPVIVATFEGVDDAITMSNVEPTVDGNKLTYVKNVAGTDYTFTFTSYHPYEAGADDETVNLVYTSAGKTSDNEWTNGLYTMSGAIDGNNNQCWKFKNGAYTLNVPSDVVVKQVVFVNTTDHYNDNAELTSFTSEGAQVWIPAKHTFGKTNGYDLVINLDNHQTGTPLQFSFANAGQLLPSSVRLIVEHVNPGVPPVKKSATATVENNHAVVAVSFDREMQATEANVNGNTVTAEGGASTLYFPVWDLDWAQTHTLTIPAGAAKDKFGNSNAEDITADIVIAAKPAVEQKAYDYVVGTVDELQAAVAAVNASNTSASAERKTIFVKNGDYALPENWKEDGVHDRYMYDIYLSCYNVSFVGQSKEGVIIHALSKGITSSTLNMGNGTGNYFENLTIRNDADFRNFNADGSLNLAGVCVAVTGGNKTILKNVAMQSNQDTYVTGARTYLLDCDVHGTVDFICGGGDIYFDHNNIILENRGGDVISAPSTSSDTKWGYVFQNCTVDRAEGATLVEDKGWTLGRPWQNEPRTYYLNTTLNVLPADAGWAGMSGLVTHFYEYNSMDADGNALDLTARKNSSSSTNTYTPVLSAAEAAKFTLGNVLGGTDSWLPTDYTNTTAAPVATATTTAIEWTAVEDARCYVIFNEAGEYVDNVATLSYTPDAEGKYYVYSANSMGGLGQGTLVTFATADDLTLSNTNGVTYGFSGYCSDRNFTVTNGTAYKAVMKDDKIVLKSLDGVVPGYTGVVIAGDKGADVTINFTNEEANVDVTDNALLGTVERTLTATLKGSAKKFITLQKSTSQFVQYTGEYFPANRAYMLLNDGNNVTTMSYDIVFSDVATGIGGVNDNADVIAPVKVITAKGIQIGNYNIAGQQVK